VREAGLHDVLAEITLRVRLRDRAFDLVGGKRVLAADVDKPAPPRPWSPELFTSSTTVSGVISPIALRAA
jgi:hypothetical protein